MAMKEMDRKNAVREEALKEINLEGYTQVATASFIKEVENGFVEVKVIAKNATFGEAELAEAVENYNFELEERAKREAKAEAKRKEKAEKAKSKE